MIQPHPIARNFNRVDNAAMRIRRLLPAESAVYREIRLEALRLAPEAFSSDFARESGEPAGWFAARLAEGAVFGAFAGDRLVGVAGFFARQGRKERHKGVLWGMYVRPPARRNGVGRRLAEAVIAHARREVEVLQLSVVGSNKEARRLYAALGFVEYGIEKDALQEGGRYWDDVLMAMRLLPKREPGP
jgi:ribosomal protein S18 acetylase RimI-like enzyme